MKQLNLKAIQEVNELLQTIQPNELASNPQNCYEIAIWCATQRSFTGEQMAIAKKEWMDKKKIAYVSFVADSETNKERLSKYGASTIKDYIQATVGEYEARHEYIERTNVALKSMEDVLRSVISSLKMEAYSLKN